MKDDQQENLTHVMPDSRLALGRSLAVFDALEMRGGVKIDITNPKALARDLKEYHKKFRLLLSYIDNLIEVNQRLENQLRQTSRVSIVGKTMSAGLAHDLRNPMAVISSCAQFCLENEKISPAAREWLNMIQEKGKEVCALLNQFVEFAKVDLMFKAINLNQIIEKTWQLALLDEGNKSHRVKFKAHLAEDLPEIFGDPEKIERTFLNLFLNAIQAVSQNSRQKMVRVETRLLPAQNVAEVAIIDNGPGIPGKIHKKLFEPFFTTKKGGTGLGLHVSQYFIEQHKGSITIGKAGKRGTKVTVSLPLSSPDSGDTRFRFSKGKVS